MLLTCTIASAQETAKGDSPAFSVYPDQDTSYNPRVPWIVPVADEEVGKRMDVETSFTYALAPFVAFPEGGTMTVQLRDNLRREEKNLVALKDGDHVLAVRRSAASKGRQAFVSLTDGSAVAGKVLLPLVVGKTWISLAVEWSRNRIKCSVNGQPAGEFEIGKPFNPRTIQLETYSVGSLAIRGSGEFRLDWGNGYAATVVPNSQGTALVGRIFGFDSYYVSDDPSRRDFPVIQVSNGSNEPRRGRFEFDLHSEVNRRNEKWSQEFSVEPFSSAYLPITFPQPLRSDIYHLRISSRGLSKEIDEEKHFAFVERRKEPPGPPKFGLHDSSRPAFGYWPDALPVPIAHQYSYWGYTVGPAWIKDFNGDWGIDPKTPAEEWNWDKRLDWDLAAGLLPYVCINSLPLLPWQREKEYSAEHMKPRPFGMSGGFPKLPLYESFVAELASKYRGKVSMYEVENEPNAEGHEPQDYLKIAQSASKAIRQADPDAKVFGMCATGDFVPWMSSVFQAGAAEAMDGISVHTYVSPSTPEQANLSGKLSEVQSLIKATGKEMPLVNSETGTYVSPRELIDQPISEERLAELIRLGTPNYVVPRGWPNRSVTELEGSASLVRNVVYNFLAGGRIFVFFSWNPAWPSPAWWTRENTGSPEGFGIISATRKGVKTPSLYSLALGVLTSQLDGLVPGTGQRIDENGILGGIFQKKNGGQVAILWSLLGKRSVILKTLDSKPEIVSLFGRDGSPSESGDSIRALVLTGDPIYVHVKQPGIEIMPSPVLNVREGERQGEDYRAGFTLVNRSSMPWKGEVLLSVPDGWGAKPASLPFSLDAGKRSDMQFTCVPPAHAIRGAYTVDAEIQLPEGETFRFPIGFTVRNTLAASSLPEDLSINEGGVPAISGGEAFVGQVDQVAVGRAPLLASTQEEQYWKGPEELSASVQVGSNSRGLFVVAKVRDANPKLPATWPGVGGSCIELFFDFRSSVEGFGRSAYGQGVYQVILKPSLEQGQKVEVWNASERTGVLEDTSVSGGPLGSDGYWIAYHIPWKAIPKEVRQRGYFGFDLAVDGPDALGKRRKSQLVWAGTAANSNNASAFGIATLPQDKKD